MVNSINYTVRVVFLLIFCFILVSCSEVPDNELPDVMGQLKDVANKEYLNNKLSQAISNEEIDDVKMYLDLAQFVGVEVESEESEKFLSEEDTFIKNSIRNTSDFSEGFISGEGDGVAAFAGSAASDFTFVGDIRDFITESQNALAEREVDYFNYTMATVGIATSAAALGSYFATAGTFGAASPAAVGATSARVSLSLIKFAKKTGKLTKPLLNVISKSVDFKPLVKVIRNLDGPTKRALKNIKASDITSPSKLKSKVAPVFDKISVAVKNIKFDKIKKVVSNVGAIKESTSIKSTLKIIKHADNQKDLGKLAKLSKKFGKRTAAILKVLGKAAIKVTGKFWKIIKGIATVAGGIIGVAVSGYMVVQMGMLGVYVVVLIGGIYYTFFF